MIYTVKALPGIYTMYKRCNNYVQYVLKTFFKGCVLSDIIRQNVVQAVFKSKPVTFRDMAESISLRKRFRLTGALIQKL